MTGKRAVLRKRADRDLEEALDFYVRRGAPRAALEFIDALEQALGAIECHPAIGSTRYATELDLPGLRCRQFKGHSHLVFFIEREHHLDVWRVLHGNRDIPAWLQPGDWGERR
ncbi:MAG TPA: type II toxin-antitoxin system RelE/ParE family toxin [Casimicrobiaceae bacterium]